MTVIENHDLTAECLCPNCMSRIDSATSAFGDKARPGPGDLSVCFYCGQPMMFKDDMRLRLLTEQEYLDLDMETREKLLLAGIASVRVSPKAQG